MRNDNLRIDMRAEDELLICCARTHLNSDVGAQIRNLIQKESIDWNYLIQRASQHRIIPILYLHLKSICSEAIPEEILETLKDNYHSNVQRNLLLLGELLKILRVFESNGITAIPYKGPVLAISIYKNLAFRGFGDLDIFVEKDDVLKAKDLLIDLGYTLEFQLTSSNGDLYLKFQRELGFFNKDLGITVEIHWKFSGLFFSFPIDFENVFEQESINNIYINNYPVLNLSAEDLLLVLCLHNAWHRWERLLWICDVNELIRTKNIDWQKVVEKADKLVVRRILFINLYLANDLMGLKIPRELFHLMESDDSSKNISEKFKKQIFQEEKKSTNLLDEVSISINIREKLIYGIKDCIKGAVNPTTYELDNMPLHPYLSFLYFLFRPVQLLRRYKIKWKF